MMDLVHIWRCQEDAVESIQFCTDRDVRVVNEDVGQKEQFVEDHEMGLDGQYREQDTPDQQTKGVFSNVKSGTSRDIHLGIGMVHSVKSPKQWRSMEPDVQEVSEEVNGNYR